MRGEALGPGTPLFLYLSRSFSYLQKNMEMGQEAGDGISRLYLRDLVFSLDNPIFFSVFIKSRKK